MSKHVESFLPYLLIFIKRIKLIIIVGILAVVFSVVNAFFLVEPEFKSTLSFLPPLKSSLGGGAGLLTSIGIKVGDDGAVDPYQIPKICESNYFQRKLIDEFNLLSYYEKDTSPNPYVLAQKDLVDDFSFEMHEKGEFTVSKILSYSFTMYHKSPDTCQLVVDYAYGLLDSILTSIVSNGAQKERSYLESEIESRVNHLDSLKLDLVNFQKDHKVYLINEQVKNAIVNVAAQKVQIEKNNLEIKKLLQFYSNSSEIEKLRYENVLLRRELNNAISATDPGVLPGLENSIVLTEEFISKSAEIKLTTEIIAFLKQQLEQAKLKESKLISGLSIIDPSIKPVYKSRPKRVLMVAVNSFVIMLILFSLIIAYELFQVYLKSDFRKLIKSELGKK